MKSMLLKICCKMIFGMMLMVPPVAQKAYYGAYSVMMD